MVVDEHLQHFVLHASVCIHVLLAQHSAHVLGHCSKSAKDFVPRGSANTILIENWKRNVMHWYVLAHPTPIWSWSKAWQVIFVYEIVQDSAKMLRIDITVFFALLT